MLYPHDVEGTRSFLLPRVCTESGHHCFAQALHELVWVFASNSKENYWKHNQGVNQQAHNDCHHKHSQQPQRVQYVGHGSQLGSNHATDSNGGVPEEEFLGLNRAQNSKQLCKGCEIDGLF